VAFFLRDKQVLNVEVDEVRLRQFIQLFEGFRATMTAGMTPEQAAAEWFLSYIIRFDEKGYRLFTANEVVDLFNQAHTVERIIIALDSKASLSSNRQTGTWAELKLDAFAPGNSWLNVTSDHRGNVDAGFCAVEEALESSKTWFRFARTGPTRFGIQLVAVIMMFTASLWGASIIASRLAVQNAFFLAFLFVFVLLSNAWTFVHPWALRRLDRLFPNIYFKRANRERWTWLWQALVASVVFAVLTALALVMFNYIASSLSPFILKR
jgi:hypothetical protein